MSIFTFILILVVAILATVLIRLVVNEIKEHITKETDRIIKTLNSIQQWNQ